MELEILERYQALVRFTVLLRDEDIRNHYEKVGAGEESELGVGTEASSIFQVVEVNNPQIRYAMKVQPIDNEVDSAESRLNHLFTEFLIPARILPKHRNRIQFKEVLVSNKNFYLVQELCARNLNLDDFSQKCDEESAHRIFKQLVHAVENMHQYGVVHCDLNEGNILFADPDFMECKIIDFGISKYKLRLAEKFHDNFNPRDWFNDEETYDEEDVRHFDIAYLGQHLFRMMLKANHPPYLDHRLPVPDYSTSLPSMKPFHQSAHDLLRHVGPPPYRARRALDKGALPPLEFILRHTWVASTARKFSFRDLDPLFASLRTDRNLILLRHILGDDVVSLEPTGCGFRLKLLNERPYVGSDFDLFYTISGFLPRRPANRHLQLAESKYIRLQRTKYVVKTIFQPRPLSTTRAAAETLRQTFGIYNELLIQLRILPLHEHIVNIRNVFFGRRKVIVVREFIGRRALRDFVPHATSDSAAQVFRQIAETVRFMHLFGVVHMDLNLDNIVLMDSSSANIQIVDFSKALYVSNLAGFQHKNFQGEQWITPELSQMASDAQATPQVDIQALGEILYAMMKKEGEPLALWPDATDLLSRIGPAGYGPFEGSPVSGLRSSRVEVKRRRTLTMDQICNHKWCEGGAKSRTRPVPVRKSPMVEYKRALPDPRPENIPPGSIVIDLTVDTPRDLHRDPRIRDPRTRDPRTDDPRTRDSRTRDPKTDDPRTRDPRTDDPRSRDPRTDDPRT